MSLAGNVGTGPRREARVMQAWLLELLRCTSCGGRLALRSGEAESAETLECAAGHRFDVRNGVPRFATEEYARSFGFQWTKFSKTQLDSANGTTESLDAFAQKTGFRPEDLRGKRVLDVGCGMGRFLEIAGDWGAKVVGVDLSVAVDAARDNLKHRENVAVVQADVFRLPFAPESFEIIYSLGVLHHTPGTRKAFSVLPPLLTPGGRIAIWVYGKKPGPVLGSDLLRPITSRLPKDFLLRMCRGAMWLGKWERRPVIGRLLQTLLPVSVHRDPEWRWLDTFDWYSPRFQHKHSFAEVEDWFQEAGLEGIRRLSFPTSVTGGRPPAARQGMESGTAATPKGLEA